MESLADLVLQDVGQHDIVAGLQGLFDLLELTLEPVDAVVREILEETSWTEECICEKLFREKILICIGGARYHIYRDCLG